MSIKRDKNWEEILRQKYQDAQESVNIARLNLEDYWDPLVDEAIAAKDFDLAFDYVRLFSDVVSAAFAADRIREAMKQRDES